MAAPAPLVQNATLPGGGATFTGSFKRIIFQNLDSTNNIGVKINGSNQMKVLPLTNLGDTYPQIDTVELINLGGTPEYQITLHG